MGSFKNCNNVSFHLRYGHLIISLTMSFFSNLFFFLNQTKCCPKEPSWFRALITARSSINRTIFEPVDGTEGRGNANLKWESPPQHSLMGNDKIELKDSKQTLKHFFILEVSVMIWHLFIRKCVIKRSPRTLWKKQQWLAWQANLS